MKTNLDQYRTDKEFELNGIWMNLSEKTGFLVSRFGGNNSTKVKAAMAKYHKPYAVMIEKGTLDSDREREINARVFVECSVHDWRGVEIDGKEAAFSKDECVKLFCELPELADAIIRYATDSSNYREEVGNS